MPTVLTKQDSGSRWHTRKSASRSRQYAEQSVNFRKARARRSARHRQRHDERQRFLSHLRNAAELSEVGPMQKRTYEPALMVERMKRGLWPLGSLRPIRVALKQELNERITAGIKDVNRYPVIHTWSYKLAEAT